ITTVTEFDAVPLTYVAKDNSNPTHWNYPGEDKFWKLGATYTFRACFPQKLMTSLMIEMNAVMIQGGPVTTTTMQEDLMVASAYVNTVSDDLSRPITLKLRHLMSAIRFQVQADEGYTPATGEGISSCWLVNKRDDDTGFSTSGYLVYNGVDTWESIVWHKYASSSDKMYYWEHNPGVTFSNTPTSLYVDDLDLTTEGDEFSQQDGWVLIVPQENDGSLCLCYTLNNAPDMVFEKNIPAITYEAGKKYNYILTISGTEVTLTLKMADWNQLDSSYDIIL
ncbi:MAG: fimbrillin family protein, partial [Parabacteroides sp.]|nr:fimbrillin family protein [Parabacteroides sp.]